MSQIWIEVDAHNPYYGYLCAQDDEGNAEQLVGLNREGFVALKELAESFIEMYDREMSDFFASLESIEEGES